MKAHAFEYLRARSLGEALAALAARPGEARVLAGGQSLVPLMNMRLASPAALVDVGAVPELRGVEVRDGCLRLGALTRHHELLDIPEIAEHAPLLARAAPYVGHAAIRNRGTLGGSLAHADPGAELPACVLALGGRVLVASTRRTRAIAAEQFFLGPYTTALDPDEILLGVDLPIARADGRYSFHEFARRAGDFAMAGLAAVGRREAGTLCGVRLAFFGLGGTPLLAPRAAAAVEGRTPTPDVLAVVERALGEDLSPQPDLHTSAAMKAHLVRVLAARTLAELAS